MSLTKHPLQKILFVILVLCCAGALVMALIQMFPGQSKSGIAVKERFTVASATIIKDGNEYSCVLNGVFTNPTDKTIAVKELRVAVSDGEKVKDMIFSAFSMPARTDYPVSQMWTDSAAWNEIESIRVEYADGSERILNTEQQGVAIDGVTVVWLAVAALLGYAAFAVWRRLCYMAQEDAMKKEQNS